MLVIRLRRIGRKHDPHYRIVVAQHTAPIQGKFIAEIGHFHPKSKELSLDEAKMMDWLTKGAKPSNTVAKLAQKAKLIHKHIVVKLYHGKTKKPKVPTQSVKEPSEPEKTGDELDDKSKKMSEETPETSETPDRQTLSEPIEPIAANPAETPAS